RSRRREEPRSDALGICPTTNGKGSEAVADQRARRDSLDLTEVPRRLSAPSLSRSSGWVYPQSDAGDLAPRRTRPLARSGADEAELRELLALLQGEQLEVYPLFGCRQRAAERFAGVHAADRGDFVMMPCHRPTNCWFIRQSPRMARKRMSF